MGMWPSLWGQTATNGDELIHGDATANTLSGGAGDDTLFGLNGEDTYL
ncbi:MAG: hypothetical protein AAF360_02530 [Pseudomonadota bacterium]